MGSKEVKLKLDWATHKAAKYACENYHYTGRIPVYKLVKLGVWEDDKYKGVIIFGLGASAVLHKSFNLKRTEICELVRVALTKHFTPVSKLLKIALIMLKKKCDKLKLCVSFADPSEGHHGGIYQANGWVFNGVSADTIEYYYNGDWRHVTDVYKRIGPRCKQLRKRTKQGKYRYLMPLKKEMRTIISKLSKPYPKRPVSIDDAPGIQPVEGGAIPTTGLPL